MEAGLKFEKTVEKYGIFEATFTGIVKGNPFDINHVTAFFVSDQEKKKVSGFYDGEGIYKVRFMPSYTGNYQFSIKTDFMEECFVGEFLVTEAVGENHGPVSVKKQTHFAYADGTPYYPVGTTCYAWVHQKKEMREQTLQTLRSSCFNKLRFCIFPKHYLFNYEEPEFYPYEGTANDFGVINQFNFKPMQFQKGGTWDFTRFNPEFFRLMEAQIARLMELGIEADLILMHPYDRWGYCSMSSAEDDRYLKYCVARFGAYRNVWWALANEFDLVPEKSDEDWERMGRLLKREDPYGHLRSIHNCRRYFDQNQDWITHCSIQRIDIYKTVEDTDVWREQWKKPIVIDEMCYEGDIYKDWGNIPGEELVRRCWEITLRGGYTGHGETFECEEELLWWSHGGVLRGASEPRLAFLRKILEETPGHGLRFKEWVASQIDGGGLCGEADTEEENPGYRLYYFGWNQPRRKRFNFTDGGNWKVEVIDTWNMTITDVGVHSGTFLIELPGRQYMGVRMVRQE